MLQRLFVIHPRLQQDLGLPHHLLGSGSSSQVLDQEIMCQGQGLLVLQLDRQFLQAFRQFPIASTPLNQGSSNGRGLRLASHLEVSLECSPQRLIAFLAGGGLQVPLHQFGRHDPLPPQPIRQGNVLGSTLLVAVVRNLQQSRQRLVVLAELLVVD